MRWADVVLDYLKVVVWPVVAITVIFLFRSQLRTLILHARKVTAFGAEAEFSDLEKRVKQTERQLDQSSDDEEKSQSSDISAVVWPELETVDSLSYIDLTSLDSLQPIAAAVELTGKLTVAVSRVLKYFGVPETIVDATSAGAIMAKLTGIDQWSEFLPLVDELVRAAKVLDACQDSPIWLNIVPDRGLDANTGVLRDSAKKVGGAAYRLAKALPTLVERSVRSMSDKPMRTLSVAVYVDGNPDAMSNVLERVDQLVQILGYGDHIDEINEQGSWFRTFTSKVRSQISQDEVQAIYGQAERALEIAHLDLRQAELDVQTADAVMKLVRSLDDVSNAVIRVGSLLIVKQSSPTGPTIVARTLSQVEIRAMEQYPEIIRQPNNVLEELTLAIQSMDTASNAEN
jgi:transcriptional regulator NrdR family protein